MATVASMESPFPYPRLSYILGANRGNPNPHRERRHETAAKADAAYRVKVSIMYA